MLTLRSAHLAVELDPSRGAEVRAVRDARGRNALAHYHWRTPARAGDGQRYGDSRLDWLSGYRGGWQETIPNAGVESMVGDLVLPFHGEASTSSWNVIEATSTSCELTTVARLPLVISRRMTLAADAPALYVETSVTNDAGTEVDFLWGHHPAFPAIPGARIDMPDCTVDQEFSETSDIHAGPTRWPHAEGTDGTPVDLRVVPDATVHRLMYLHGHTAGWAAIRQPAGHAGVAMAWDVSAYPAMWLWTMRHTTEFPWYGRMAVVALEPQRAWPFDGLANASARGQAMTLKPHQTASAWLTMVLLPDGTGPVRGVTRDGVVTT